MKGEKLYTYRFTVAGYGPFPFDMLRYDCCYPVHESEARGLDQSGPMHVELERHHADRSWHPTYGRWDSFLFKVVAEDPPR